MFCIYFNPKYGATDLAYSTCGKYDFIGKTSPHSQTGQLIRLNLYQKKKFGFMFKLKALSYSKFFHKLTVTPHSRSRRPRQNLSRSLSRMKEALPVSVSHLSSPDTPSGAMRSQVIPSFGDKAQLRMAEGCLSVVKSHRNWEGEAGQEKSVQCQPFLGRSVSGEGPGVAQNLEIDLLNATYAGYSQGDYDSKEPGLYPTKWAVQNVEREHFRNSIYTCSCILVDVYNLHKSEVQ